MKKLQLKKDVIESLDKAAVKGGMAPDTHTISWMICPGNGTSGICSGGCPSRTCPAIPKTDGDMISCRNYPPAIPKTGLTIYVDNIVS